MSDTIDLLFTLVSWALALYWVVLIARTATDLLFRRPVRWPLRDASGRWLTFLIAVSFVVSVHSVGVFKSVVLYVSALLAGVVLRLVQEWRRDRAAEHRAGPHRPSSDDDYLLVQIRDEPGGGIRVYVKHRKPGAHIHVKDPVVAAKLRRNLAGARAMDVYAPVPERDLCWCEEGKT